MIWIKLLTFFTKAKEFIKKHWKVFVVLIALCLVAAFFMKKINILKNEIDVLTGQVERYQGQVQRDRQDIADLNQLYETAMEQQTRFVNKYNEDMRALADKYQADMNSLRQEALGARNRNSVRYSQTPSEGTTALSTRFGIPIGDRER